MEKNLNGSLAYCDNHVKVIKVMAALSDKVEKWADRLSQTNGIGKRKWDHKQHKKRHLSVSFISSGGWVRMSSLDGANDLG
jgi:hypothetical protein